MAEDDTHEPFRFLLTIKGEGPFEIPIDVTAHITARERGDALRDWTLKIDRPLNLNPCDPKRSRWATRLETAITMTETLAILDTLGIHRAGVENGEGGCDYVMDDIPCIRGKHGQDVTHLASIEHVLRKYGRSSKKTVIFAARNIVNQVLDAAEEEYNARVVGLQPAFTYHRQAINDRCDELAVRVIETLMRGEVRP